MEQQSNDFQNGDLAYILNRKREKVNCFFSYVTPDGRAYLHEQESGKGYRRDLSDVFLLSRADENGTNSLSFSQPTERPKMITSVVKNLSFDVEEQKFDINKRFDILAALCRMTMKGVRKALVITGEGGLGKTYTVKEQLDALGLEPVDKETGCGDYKFVKGFSTAKGIYNTLFQHRDRLIIFDDCDEALQDKIAKNLFKAALDSYDERIISWSSARQNQDVPNEFLFSGQVIFISNMDKSKMDKAVLTRCSKVDVSMTADEKIERMIGIVLSGKYMPDVSEEIKFKALDFIDDNKNTNNLSLRTLEEIVTYIVSDEENWEEIAEYSIQSFD